MVEGCRPAFLTPNNEEIGQHSGICSYVLVQILQGLSGHAPDGRGDEAFASSDETHPCFSTDSPSATAEHRHEGEGNTPSLS